MYLQGEIIAEYRMRGDFHSVSPLNYFDPSCFYSKTLKKKNWNNIELDHYNVWRSLPEKTVQINKHT